MNADTIRRGTFEQVHPPKWKVYFPRMILY